MALSTKSRWARFSSSGSASSSCSPSSGRHPPFQEYYTLDVLFEAVGGLEKDDQVTMGGMEIGHVSDLILEDKQSGCASPAPRVPDSEDRGLQGGRHRDHGREKGGDLLGRGDRCLLLPRGGIRGVTTPGLSEAIGNLGESGAKIEEILASVKKVADRLARAKGRWESFSRRSRSTIR